MLFKKHCEIDEHNPRHIFSKRKKTYYACRHLNNGPSAVHVIHEIVDQMHERDHDPAENDIEETSCHDLELT